MITFDKVEAYVEFLKANKEPNLDIQKGRRYARIVRVEANGESAFGFVDMTNGDILKPAGWKGPAKIARGNVLDQSSWDASATRWGVAYLK